jgi:ECF transporter S component (folate family)
MIKKEKKSRSKFKISTRQITMCGIFISLYLITYYFNLPITQMIQIRFGFLVLAIAGFVGGPVMAMTIAIVGDILSVMITGQWGSFLPGLTLSYAFMGMCFGLIFHKSQITVFRVICAGLVEFLVSLFLNTFWLSFLYKTPYFVMLMARLPKNCIMLVINTVIMYMFLKAFSKVFKYKEILN